MNPLKNPQHRSLRKVLGIFSVTCREKIFKKRFHLDSPNPLIALFAIIKKHPKVSIFYLAGDAGIEPTLAVLETAALPIY